MTAYLLSIAPSQLTFGFHCLSERSSCAPTRPSVASARRTSGPSSGASQRVLNACAPLFGQTWPTCPSCGSFLRADHRQEVQLSLKDPLVDPF